LSFALSTYLVHTASFQFRKGLDTIQFIEKLDRRDLIYVTGSKPQERHRFITGPDTLIAKQDIERDTRSGYAAMGFCLSLDRLW